MSWRATLGYETERAAKFHADLGGWFWLPCPSCGDMFGGHEHSRDDINGHGHDSSIPHPDYGTNPYTFQGICPNCTAHGVGCHARATGPQPRMTRPGHGAHCLSE
jgi:hypothetical protein